MVVWRKPPPVRDKAISRKSAQMKSKVEKADPGAGLGNAVTVKEQAVSSAITMRTPEQTALIALRGLLEAKEMQIEKLQVIHSLATMTCSQRPRNFVAVCNSLPAVSRHRCSGSSKGSTSLL